MSTDDEQIEESIPNQEPLDDEEPGGDDNGLPPRTLLAALGTIAVVAVLAIAILSERNGGDGDDVATATSQAQSDESNPPADGGEPGDVELGSLSVTGYSCPEASSPDTDCLEAGTAEITNATFVLEDGTEVGIEASTDMQDGSLAWLNVPTGTYRMPADALAGPEGMEVRNVIGAVEPTDDGWSVSNLDPNQPAVIQVLFIPEGGSPAAG